ncbi:MAG: hypothetical protein MUD17_03110 [Gemmatimonadaceae bacterium]|jgi:hypothetical protein|nr:hypothetical protein [Gemmatimonadaceae bacterium]
MRPLLLGLALWSWPVALRAQAAPLAAADVKALATVQVRLFKLQDSLNAEMAHPRNKKPEEQTRLQEALRTAVEATITAAGLTPAEYTRRRALLATHEPTRQAFDEAVVALQGGAPAPGTVAAAAAPQPEQPKLPAGPVGTHLGHVLVSFMDTPNKVGLLAIAKEEATIAAQHAAFAARTPGNLESMQRHAGHVLHAIDPTIEATGPGKGYGVKKAANGVAAHTELAARSEGAAAGVKTHAEHVATAARTTVTRADEIVALAQKIRAATTAEAAATLVAQLVSLCEQLSTGTDLNADGRIGWNNSEGGLQQAEEHLKLLLATIAPSPGN